MRRALVILAVAACVMTPAHARLGETEQESIARYGPAVGIYEAGTKGYGFRTLTFDHAGYTIIVQMMDGECEMICFQKPDGGALTPDELDLLLKAQSNGQAWVRSQLVSADIIFDRPDGVMARYDTKKHAFAFCSAKYIKASDAQRSADEKRKLDSL